MNDLPKGNPKELATYIVDKQMINISCYPALLSDTEIITVHLLTTSDKLHELHVQNPATVHKPHKQRSLGTVGSKRRALY